MCKKLLFLISLVLVLGLTAGAYADALKVDWPDTYTVSGSEEYDYFEIGGTCIVPEGATLTANGRSRIDDNGGDGEGGDEYAHMIVDGGTVVVHDRVDIGTDHDGYLTITGGGSFTQDDDSDGLKLPDEEGGTHRIILIDGSYSGIRIELIDYRDGKVLIGCGATLYLSNSEEGDDRDDPQKWLDGDDLVPISPLTKEEITIERDGDEVTVTTPGCMGECAQSPSPGDNEVGVNSAITHVVLEWTEAEGVADTWLGKNILYFSTSFNDVYYAPPFEWGWEEPPAFVDILTPGTDPVGQNSYDMGTLPIWAVYYWRVDSGKEDASYCQGDVWTFYTGCTVDAADVDMNCLINFEDYALMMSTWRDEQLFPVND
jgi:hypothetical protein